jgi:hypothetical protein
MVLLFNLWEMLFLCIVCVHDVNTRMPDSELGFFIQSHTRQLSNSSTIAACLGPCVAVEKKTMGIGSHSRHWPPRLSMCVC